MKADLRALKRSLFGNGRRFLNDAITREIEKRTGLLSIDDTRAGDVFICGYPKSGNTWFQYMASALVYGADVQLSPDSLVNDLIPDVHFRKFYRRYGDACYFKTHHAPLPSYRRIVYLLRDGRDAMVSYYHHLAAMSGAIDFRDMIETGRGLPGKWHSHVESYLENPHGAEMIIIRYEDLKTDTVGQLGRFCSFAGLTRTAAALERVAEKTTFDKMRAKEQKAGWEDGGWPKDKAFVRRGVVGSFRDEMPADVLQIFMRDAGRVLESQGYLSAKPDAREGRAT